MTKSVREVIMLVHYDDNTVAEIRGFKCSSLMGESTYTDSAGNVVDQWEASVLGRKDLTVTYQLRFSDVEAYPDGAMYRYRAVPGPEEKEEK